MPRVVKQATSSTSVLRHPPSARMAWTRVLPLARAAPICSLAFAPPPRLPARLHLRLRTRRPSTASAALTAAVTSAAKQFQGMNLNGKQQYQQYPQTPNTPGMGFYGQQVQSGMQPIVQPVPNQPGLFLVYNPMTGQQSYVVDPAVQQNSLPASPPTSMPGYESPDTETAQGYFRRNNMSPNSMQAAGRTRTITPPKQTPSPPADVEPLPEPSANAFRPGHRKSMSIALSKDGGRTVAPGPKTAGFPATPMTGTFGPGMGRAGEHPIRQPRGPPNLEELLAAPTSKHEGSKNFATRQRRRAVFNLVRAGNERRTGRSGSRDTGASGSDADTASSDAGSDGQPSAAPRSWRSSMLM
ncbi:hypothetical protein FH972_023337 [Carpinus fangiana]|uniref:Uncharacterized protein n=1 Tax=Carpinus fangiana TaxID=176857 RepID=A0A5N6KVD8_9ROSI|nr:hypothetical protein FH972_023337 [Carpinus fangiana]